MSITDYLEMKPSPLLEQNSQLVRQYLSSLPHKVRRLQELLDAQDFNTLRSEAHKLGGSAGSYGLPHIAKLAQALELQSASKNRISDSSDLRKHLDELMQQLVKQK